MCQKKPVAAQMRPVTIASHTGAQLYRRDAVRLGALHSEIACRHGITRPAIIAHRVGPRLSDNAGAWRPAEISLTIVVPSRRKRIAPGEPWKSGKITVGGA